MNVSKQITNRVRCYLNGLRSTFCVSALAIASTVLASGPAASQELVRLPIFGGYGGNDFEYICGPGRVLVGVRGYSGVWIDNVQAICAKFEDNGLADPQREGPVFGGDRPTTNYSTCFNINTADYRSTVGVAGLEIDVNKHKRFLGYIRPVCADIITRSFLPGPVKAMRGTGLIASEPDNSSGSELLIRPKRQECPAGMVAVGIRGRAGQFLDALGLVCGPKPAPPVTLNKRKRNPPATLGKRKLSVPSQSTEVSQPVREPEPVSQSTPVPPPTAVPPFINANPAVVMIAAGKGWGTTMLTWDGGKDHPYAEVWVKVDAADETFIVEQGKGTRQVTIEPGKTYLFILTDAGQRLATVNVRVKL